MIEYLDWDSTFFDIKIGRYITTHLSHYQIESLFKLKKENHYDLIYLFSESMDKRAEKLFSELQIVPFDQKVTYTGIVTDQTKLPQLPDNIRLFKGPLKRDLLDLALLSGHESRFKKDPRLVEKFDELYKSWVEKSLKGEMANAVFVYQDDSQIQGFVTVKKNGMNGQIGLISVHPSVQGKGIGTKLIDAAHWWYYQNQLHTCSVVTQFTNKAACNLYERNGYEASKKEDVFHL